MRLTFGFFAIRQFSCQLLPHATSNMGINNVIKRRKRCKGRPLVERLLLVSWGGEITDALDPYQPLAAFSWYTAIMTNDVRVRRKYRTTTLSDVQDYDGMVYKLVGYGFLFLILVKPTRTNERKALIQSCWAETNGTRQCNRQTASRYWYRTPSSDTEVAERNLFLPLTTALTRTTKK